MFDKKENTIGSRIYLDKENSNVVQTLYIHVHRFEALPSIICTSISCGQVIKVLRHKKFSIVKL